jgi:hypothetical protein
MLIRRRRLTTASPSGDAGEEPGRTVARTVWRLAYALTQEDEAAGAVTTAVLGRLPPWRTGSSVDQLDHGWAAFVDLIAATTETAALHIYSLSDRRPPDFPETDPARAALARAFGRRLSWSLQAPLWAVDVEGIPEAPVCRRLNVTPGRLEAARADVRRAYLDLRDDLTSDCRRRLQLEAVPGSGTDWDRRWACGDGCPVCGSERRRIAELGLALSDLSVPLPPAVWERARAVLVASRLVPEAGPLRAQSEQGSFTRPEEQAPDDVVGVLSEGVRDGAVPDAGEAVITPAITRLSPPRIMQANLIRGALVANPRRNPGGEAEQEQPALVSDEVPGESQSAILADGQGLLSETDPAEPNSSSQLEVEVSGGGSAAAPGLAPTGQSCDGDVVSPVATEHAVAVDVTAPVKRGAGAGSRGVRLRWRRDRPPGWLP